MEAASAGGNIGTGQNTAIIFNLTGNHAGMIRSQEVLTSLHEAVRSPGAIC
jgi:hypothetical protein